MLRLTEGVRSDDDGTGTGIGTGLHRSEQLIERTGATVLAVHLHVDGDTSNVPAALVRCAHRIVQESVTKTVKHANAALMTVRLSAVDSLPGRYPTAAGTSRQRFPTTR